MANELRKQAKELAARPYSIRLVIDNSVPGEILFLALNSELEGCMAQGRTMKEAVDYLHDVRIEHIEHLLEHNLSVPEPATTATSTASITSPAVDSGVNTLRKNVNVSLAKMTILGTIEDVAQPEGRGQSIELQGDLLKQG